LADGQRSRSLRGSWGTEYYSTLIGVSWTQEGARWPPSGPLVIEDGVHECDSGGLVVVPSQCEACGGNTQPVWAINRRGFRIWAINGTGWGETMIFTTTPVTRYHYGGATIQRCESLAVQQVQRALLRPPRASVGGPTGSAGRCYDGEVYTTSHSCQVISLPRRRRRGSPWSKDRVCIEYASALVLIFPNFSYLSPFPFLLAPGQVIHLDVANRPIVVRLP
jgi:hypothetical protein